jgi:hypothetical protein
MTGIFPLPGWLAAGLRLAFAVRTVDFATGFCDCRLTGTTVAHFGQRTAFPSAVSGACMP